MEIGFVGLGRMGLNMVTRLVRGGHSVIGFDRSADAVGRAKTEGAGGVASLDELVRALKPPRAVWVMVPAGAPTESTIDALAGLLSPGDTIIDGGNSNFHDDVRRAKALAAKQVAYVDGFREGPLKRISVNGGPSGVIVERVTGALGAKWMENGEILYSNGGQGIFSVPANGGQPKLIVKEAAPLIYPQLLPGGNQVVFSLNAITAQRQIVVQDLANGTRRTLASIAALMRRRSTPLCS